jgi:transketolase
MEIIQPCNPIETEMVVAYCVNNTLNNCAIRMNISPSPRKINLPDDYLLEYGKGISLTKGEDAVLIAYGPVMLHEALIAHEILNQHNITLEVINMPWLNRVDLVWLKNLFSRHNHIFILEDHSPVGGLGDFLLREASKKGLLNQKQVQVFAVEGFPACGTPSEALKYHGLDGESLANSIKTYQYGKQNFITSGLSCN